MSDRRQFFKNSLGAVLAMAIPGIVQDLAAAEVQSFSHKGPLTKIKPPAEPLIIYLHGLDHRMTLVYNKELDGPLEQYENSEHWRVTRHEKIGV